jgi:hypothetical protein
MPIRSIAVFHCTTQIGVAWGCAGGIVSTLSKQGYQVLDCGHPHSQNIPIEMLSGVDLIIMGAPEWFDEMLLERYADQWGRLTAPKIAWYAESAYRDDRNFDFARCRAVADLHYFPAAQDADEFGGEWLPFGVDTSVFYPMAVETRYNAAFLGGMYPKRLEYIKKIEYPISVIPQFGRENPMDAVRQLAEAYNSTHIFVNMPAYSRLLVTKITEVMACRTMLVTPAMDHPSATRNMTQFENGKHLIFYDPNKPSELGGILEHYLKYPAEREQIAAAGWKEVNERHSLRQRTERLVRDAEAFIRRRERAKPNWLSRVLRARSSRRLDRS